MTTTDTITAVATAAAAVAVNATLKVPALLPSLSDQIPDLVKTVLAGAAGGLLTHFLARRRDNTKHARELATAEDKRMTDQQIISTGLIFSLEAFACECAAVAADSGQWRDSPGKQSVKRAVTPLPELVLDSAGGNWQSLPGSLIYRLRELPVTTAAARLDLHGRTEHLYDYDVAEYFALRQEHYALPGLKAIRLARELRRLCGFPDTPLASTQYSALQVLWPVHWRQLRRRAEENAWNDAGEDL